MNHQPAVLKILSTSIVLISLLLNFEGQAQIVCVPNTSANALAQSLVGTGVIVSNATLNCPAGAAGTFTTGSISNLGTSSGIVLSSTWVTSIPGNSSNGLSNATCTSTSGCGDNDLNSIISPYITRDACVLEFDVFSIADTLKFNYVFASKEYPNYVCTQYNDVFAFFISGPGITGPYSNNSKNIALLPSPPIPVSINNVNHGNPSSPPNPPSSSCPPNNPQYFVNNQLAAQQIISFNGFTTVLTAVAVVQPCNTYHLKLAIADASDQILDSGVFIEAGSLISTGLTLQATTQVGNSYPYAVEGCNNGKFIFRTNQVDTVPQTIHFGIGGDAINGVDYTFIADSAVMPANTDSVVITIAPINDGLTETLETVTLYVLDPCFGNPLDSAKIKIQDSITISTNTVPAICPGDSIQIIASGGLQYAWTPGSTLTNDSIKNPWAKPPLTTTYTVQGKVAGCISYDSVHVQVYQPPPANAGQDKSICIGFSTQLNASGGSTYSWSPSTGLSAANIPNPVANPLVTTKYFLMVVDSVGCVGYDSVTVTVNPLPNAQITPSDTTVCPGDLLQMVGSGGVQYQWSPGLGLSNPNIANPYTLITAPATYTLAVTDANGCTFWDTITIGMHTLTDPMAAPDTSICYGQQVTLQASGGINYSWTPAANLNNPNLSTPLATIYNDIDYVVEITDINRCKNFDTVTIKVLPLPVPGAGNDEVIFFGNSIQLNGSGGISYQWVPAGSLDDPQAQNPIAKPKETTIYTVYVTSPDGCVNEAMVKIDVVFKTEIYPPSGFSPNGDGVNDEFIIHVYDELVFYRLQVFNRWGEKIFQTNDQYKGWDGKFQGEDQEVGTYVFIVEGVNTDGASILERGNITLLR